LSTSDIGTAGLGRTDVWNVVLDPTAVENLPAGAFHEDAGDDPNLLVEYRHNVKLIMAGAMM
jgi:hypothetical protein